MNELGQLIPRRPKRSPSYAVELAISLLLLPMCFLFGYVIHDLFPPEDILSFFAPVPEYPEILTIAVATSSEPTTTTLPEAISIPLVQADAPTSTASSTAPDKQAADFTRLNTPVTYTPGRGYVLEEFLLVGEDRDFILNGYVSRVELADNKYQQRTSLYVYDDKQWVEEGDVSSVKSLDIYKDDIVSSWSNVARDTRVLEEQLDASVVMNGQTISFKTGILSNEMGLRSLPSYTKFQSEGDAVVTVGAETFKAHILFVRLYSNDVSQTAFLNSNYFKSSNRLTTHWIAYWDEDDNFYFVDSTDVTRMAVDAYSSHQFGFYKSAETGVVERTFDIDIQANKTIDPTEFSVQFGAPINRSIDVKSRPELIWERSNVFKSWMYAPSLDSQGELNGVIQYVHN